MYLRVAYRVVLGLVRNAHPRKALRGGISKVNIHQVCQLLTTISHKIASRTGQSGVGITPRRAFWGVTAPVRFVKVPERERVFLLTTYWSESTISS